MSNYFYHLFYCNSVRFNGNGIEPRHWVCKKAYLVPVPSQDSGRVTAGKTSSVKMGDDGGGLLISPDRVALCQMVGVSASVISPCTRKVQKKIFFWYRLSQWSRKRAVKWLCGCV